MKCKQKHKNGRPCKYDTDNDSQFCYVHNPSLLPVFFIGNIDNHERNEYEINLSIEKSQSYIDSGFALKMDYAFRVKMEKTVLRLITKSIKDRLNDIKEYIFNDDKESLNDFFKVSTTNSSDKILSFINSKDFSNKEQTYLKNYMKSIMSRKRI